MPSIITNLKSWFFYWFPLFMLAAIPVLTDWIKNHGNDTLEDLFLPLILALGLSVVVSLFFFNDFRKNKFSGHVIGVLAILLLGSNYENRFGNLGTILSLRVSTVYKTQQTFKDVFLDLVFPLIVVIIAKISASYSRKLLKNKNWKTEMLSRMIVITISVAFLLQFFSALQIIYVQWPQFFYRPPEMETKAVTSDNKPDIYYIVLDRYASQSVLKNQYNFDNQDFIQFLTNNGFETNPNAHNNYPYTTMSIASTLNASYLSDIVQKFKPSSIQTLEPYHDSIRYSPVIKKLKSLGYTYFHLGSWYEASNRAPMADYYYQPDGHLVVFGHDFILNDFAKNKLYQSIFWHYIHHGLKIKDFSLISFSEMDGATATLYKINTLKNIANKKPGGKFIFAHILVPHDPYYFNADGNRSTNPSADDVGKPIKQKYLGQLQFISGQIKDVISQIQKNSDGKAVVILQTDEGPKPQLQSDNRFSFDYGGDMRKWPAQDLQMKYGNLAAYYIPQAKKEDISSHGDSVNIFRLVLNTYFKTNLAYLPKCYYGFPKGEGKPFNYTDITQLLTGKANPACSADSSFK